MLYNTSNELDKKKAVTKFNSLLEKKCIIELTEKTNRTLKQNSYLHLCFGIVAMDHGTTAEEVKKHLFKGVVNKDYYFIKRVLIYGVGTDLYKSTADTTTSRLTLHIDRFRNYCSYEYGIYIPAPEEHEIIKQAQIEINNYKKYKL